MNRLLVHVEGQTEEDFVNEVLAPHLCGFGILRTEARLLGNARQRNKRGGIKAWESSKKDILHHIKEDPGSCSTTMVDFYALPQSDSRGWPGRASAALLPAAEKAPTVEQAMFKDLSQSLENGLPPGRFVPFVMMHEFEALLFSDCAAFGNGIEQPNLIPSFQAIRDQFATPEEINDSPHTAPSKRVEGLVESYQKPFHGTLAALEVGLEAMRRDCPHFASWLTKLETLSENS